jgi:hypothetical protein
VLAVVVSFIVVFCFNVCNVCYLSVVLLYYCHWAKAQLQFNIYIYSSIHRSAKGKETADLMALFGSKHPFVGL